MKLISIWRCNLRHLHFTANILKVRLIQFKKIVNILDINIVHL